MLIDYFEMFGICLKTELGSGGVQRDRAVQVKQEQKPGHGLVMINKR